MLNLSIELPVVVSAAAMNKALNGMVASKGQPGLLLATHKELMAKQPVIREFLRNYSEAAITNGLSIGEVERTLRMIDALLFSIAEEMRRGLDSMGRKELT